MVTIKIVRPSLQSPKSRDWEIVFTNAVLIALMLLTTFQIGRNFERERARADGYEEGFVQVAEDVKHNWECIYPTDACLRTFSDITDY